MNPTQTFANMMGFPADELVGQDWFDIVDPKVADKLASQISVSGPDFRRGWGAGLGGGFWAAAACGAADSTRASPGWQTKFFQFFILESFVYALLGVSENH